MKSILALCLTIAPACFPPPAYEPTEYEVHVRIDPAGETLALLLLERGIHTSSPDTGKAHDALRAALQQKRVLPPEGGWLALDLDEEEKELAERLAEPRGANDDASGRESLDLCRSARVERVGLHVDEKDRLALFQLWRFDKARMLLDWANRKTNENLVAQADRNGSPSLGFPLLDETSWRRAVDRARQGGTWVRFEEGCLLVDLPITREGAAKCLAAVLENGDVGETWRSTLSGATSIEIDDQRTILRFCGGAGGWIRLFRIETGTEYDGRLAQELLLEGLVQASAPTLEEHARFLDAAAADPRRSR